MKNTSLILFFALLCAVTFPRVSARTTETISHSIPYNFPTGTTTMKSEVTDVIGNNDDYTSNVTIEDEEDPVITFPAPSDLYTAYAGQCYASLSFPASATDHCGIAGINYYICTTQITINQHLVAFDNVTGNQTNRWPMRKT